MISDCQGIVNYVGDTFCDDDNNNLECDYDGGDCCGGQMTFCSVCWCAISNMTFADYTEYLISKWFFQVMYKDIYVKLKHRIKPNLFK